MTAPVQGDLFAVVPPPPIAAAAEQAAGRRRKATVAEQARRLCNKEALRDALADGEWHSTAELAERAGLRFGARVYELRGEGLVVHTAPLGRGQFLYQRGAPGAWEPDCTAACCLGRHPLGPHPRCQAERCEPCRRQPAPESEVPR